MDGFVEFLDAIMRWSHGAKVPRPRFHASSETRYLVFVIVDNMILTGNYGCLYLIRSFILGYSPYSGRCLTEESHREQAGNAGTIRYT